MIAYIKGEVTGICDNYILLECNGIGYQIYVSGKFLERLNGLHSELKVYTHMHIREDDLSLYGFYDSDELEIFEILIGISGVGPKAAMSILTALSINELRAAVISEDVKAITKANGIGAKGASRIILELKDKLKMEDMLDAVYENSISQTPSVSDVQNDVIKALVNLGYSSSEASGAIRKVRDRENMTDEDLLKAALKNIF
ncbi:MAG: Holliday junction branch migration protein RuvA [Coprococcus sp.]